MSDELKALVLREYAGLQDYRVGQQVVMRRQLARALQGFNTRRAGYLSCTQPELLIEEVASDAAQRLLGGLEEGVRFVGDRAVLAPWMPDGAFSGALTPHGWDAAVQRWEAEYANPLQDEITNELIRRGFRPAVTVQRDGSVSVVAAQPGEGR